LSPDADAARILIVAGEASGDLYGGLLMRAMTRPRTGAMGSATFLGAGGPSMRAAGLRSLGDAGAMGVTGLLEVLRSLGVIWRVYREARKVLDDPDRRPDLVLLIDYPDFNLRLARRSRRAGTPVLYFVSPQVWAWRKGRVRRIARCVDRMLVILPFEEEIYRRASVPVEFVGHPLLDLARPTLNRQQVLGPLGLDPLRPTVALLPGSRRNELRSHLPAMLGAVSLLRAEFRDVQVVIAVAPTVGRVEMDRVIDRVQGLTGPGGVRPVLVEENRYEALAASDCAVVASGTATLEAALLGVPMVIVYRMSPLSYAAARLLLHVPHIGMPNLIAGERVVPELVQGECRPDRIAREVRRILTDPRGADDMRQKLRRVRERLGRPGAIERVAGVAWGMIVDRRGTRVA
jgi:lipid-A-disaccharide synthase